MLFSLFVFSCAPKSNTIGIDTGQNQQDTTNSEGPNLTDADYEASEACETYGDTLHPGASTYFAGSYVASGESYVGVEEAVYVANSTWEPILGASECRIKWDISAEAISNSACTTCDLNVEVNAVLDAAQSNCPTDLLGPDNWSEIYGIALNDDGTSSWHYGSDGSIFGTGTWAGEQMGFLTEVQCSWF